MAILADDGFYTLKYLRNRYRAGCRNFAAKEAVAHWKSRLAEIEQPCTCINCNRARLFIKAIRKNERALKQ